MAEPPDLEDRVSTPDASEQHLTNDMFGLDMAVHLGSVLLPLTVRPLLTIINHCYW